MVWEEDFDSTELDYESLGAETTMRNTFRVSHDANVDLTDVNFDMECACPSLAAKGIMVSLIFRLKNALETQDISLDAERTHHGIIKECLGEDLVPCAKSKKKICTHQKASDVKKVMNARVFSFVHSVVVSLFLALNWYEPAILISKYYFTLDTCFLLKTFSQDALHVQLGMLLHHAIALYMLFHYPDSKDDIFEGVNSMYRAAEISNIAITAAALLKRHLSETVFAHILRLEFYIYAVCRCFWMGSTIFTYWSMLDGNLQNISIFFYLIGLYWTTHLYHRLFPQTS